MTIDEVYRLIQFIADKNMQGNITPSQFNLIINQSGRSYQAYLLGSFQSYSNGRPIARVELGQNSVVRQRLTPSIYNYILNVNQVTGRCDYPSDYIQTDSMMSIYGRTRVTYVQQDSLDSYYNSVIDPIATNPIYLIEDVGFQFYPENIWRARLSYVRNLPDMVWAYLLDGNGRPVYNPNASVQPLWDDVSMMEIIARALAMVGVNLQASAISQYAEQIKKEGQ